MIGFYVNEEDLAQFITAFPHHPVNHEKQLREMIKNSLLSILFCVGLMTLFAFQTIRYEPKVSTAEVQQIEGFYIFTDSKPVMPYDSLGVVNLGVVGDTQYESIRKNLIKRARKDFSEGNGLIMDLNKGGLDKCIVIRFR